jgi:hypothetical protein
MDPPWSGPRRCRNCLPRVAANRHRNPLRNHPRNRTCRRVRTRTTQRASFRTSGSGHLMPGSTRFRKRGRAPQPGHHCARHRVDTAEQLVVNHLLSCRHDRPDPVDTGTQRPGVRNRRTSTATSSAGTLLVALDGPLAYGSATRWSAGALPLTVPNAVPARPDNAVRAMPRQVNHHGRPLDPGATRAPCTCGGSRNSPSDIGLDRLLCSSARG